MPAPRRLVVHLCLALGSFAGIYLTAAPVQAAPCPATRAQSSEWVNRSVTVLVRSAYAAYLNESADLRYRRVIESLANTIERCRLASDNGLSRSYPEFFEYVKLLSITGKDDHELGFEIPDKDYFAETSQYTTIPDFLLTPTFLRLVSGFENLPRAKSFLRELNKGRSPTEQLLFFSYTSRHLGTPDNPDSYRRLLIVVPGDSARGVPEKWVQFGIADPGKARSVRNVSVVAVTRSETAAADVYFKDYYRTYRRNGSISIKGRWELGEGDDPCVTCHKSGVLPIFPVAGTVSNDEKEILNTVNDRFRGYGVGRFGRYLDAAAFGPGLGTTRGPATPGITSLTARFKTPSATTCHNKNGLGALNWPMDETLIKSFVTGGQMPLNANLAPLARTQLYRQLVNEYFAVDQTQPGILQAWLLGKMRIIQNNPTELDDHEN